MYEEVGDIIRRKRIESGWDQAELARRLGAIGQQTVSRWERGMSRPRRRMVAQVAVLFGLDVDDLLRAAGYVAATADSPKEARRPVRPLVTTLPLHELAPDLFERFSADLAQLLYPNAKVERQGSQGHKQYGIDIAVQHQAGKPTGIQCKREKQFGPAKVQSAVGQLKLDVRECFIFLTRVASPEARKEIRNHRKWKLCDVEDISRTVRSLPLDAAVRLIDTYFPGWREPFLGVPAPGPWLTGDEFFRSSSGDRIYTHDWQLIGRAEELDSLLSFVAGNNRRLAALIGRGALGKTRLLRAVALNTERQKTAVVRFLAQGITVRPEDYELLPCAERLLVIIDDAHDRGDIAMLVAGIDRARPSAHVLMALRPSGVGQFTADLRRIGLHPSELPTWQLDDLRATDAYVLARMILGEQFNDAVAQRLAVVGTDCPLLIVVGATLINRGQLDAGLLEGSDSIRNEILWAFRDALVADPTVGDPELRREVLKGVAVMQPFRTGDGVFQAAMAELTRRPYDQIVPQLRSLEGAGILLRRGESVRIVPDLLGDVILAQAVVHEHTAAATGYVDRVRRAADGLALQHALVNASRVDWLVRQKIGDKVSLTEAFWPALEAEFIDAGVRDRLAILHLLKKIAFFQPKHVLSVIREAIDNPPDQVEHTDDPLTRLHSPSYEEVLRELPPLLENVAYNIEYLREAADLLWKLSQGDVRPTNQHPEHPIRILSELAGYGIGRSRIVNETILATAEGWIKQQDVEESSYSPFDVLDHLLATEGAGRRSDGLTLTFTPYSVKAEVVQTLRQRVIGLALSEARSNNPRRAVRAIKTIGEGIGYPSGLLGRMVSTEECDQWTPTFVDTIGRLADLMSKDELDPVIAIAARQALHWHAYHSPFDTKAAAQRALDQIPVSLDRELALVLHDGWGHLYEQSDDYQEAQRRRQARFDSVANAVVTRWSDIEAVDRLADRLRLNRRAFGNEPVHPGPFVWTLVRAKLSIGELICRRVVADPGSVLLDVASVTLGPLAEALPGRAVALTNELLSTGSIDVARQVAHAFGWGRGARDYLVDGEADLLRRLVQHEDVAVRRSVILGTRQIATSNHSFAAELVTAVRFQDAKIVAGEVLSVFGRHGYLSWDELTESQASGLIAQLRECPAIDDYHVADFLGNLSKHHPKIVLRLLMDRVEMSERPESADDYHALPYAWHTQFHFREHGNFSTLLRMVRNWIATKVDSWKRQRMGADIFRVVAQQFDEQVIEILDQALVSGYAEQVRAVGSILNEAPRPFVWDNIDFVSRALNVASECGQEFVQSIGGGLHSSVMTGGRTGAVGEPFQEDIELRDRSANIAKTWPVGSIERRFYESLASSAEHSIGWDTENDADLMDRRDW